MSEPAIDASVEAVAARVDGLLAAGGRRIVGFTGAPGSGKSTLASDLISGFAGRAALVPMDGFHLANGELARLGRSGRKGAADTFDGPGFVALLERLRVRRPAEIVYAPEFRREIEEPVAGAIAVLPEHDLIVTEGNYLLLETGAWAEVRRLLDAVWYVDIDDGLRLERLIARHMRFGRSAAEAREWVARTDEPNARLIATTRERADGIVRLAAENARPPS